MKKILYTIATLLLLAAASCQEWEPVWGNQGTPGEPQAQTLAVNTTIADLKALYEGTPYHIEKDIVIGGQVISSDASGNIYRSLFIQDETGGIELKIGNSSLYNDYKTGQWVYVKCQGLTLGNYSGMLQLGMEDPTESYETAYMDVKRLIGAHIFKGAKAAPVTPRVISENELKDALKRSYKSPCFGTLVTLQNLTYANEIFVLIYLSFAAAYAMEPAVGSAVAFSIVAAFYLIVLALFVTFRKKWIERPLVKFLASLLMEK